MQQCPVLPEAVSRMLLPLRDLIGSMEARERLPQIELAVGEGVTALVLRNLEPLSAPDADRLRAFAAEHGVQWWLQPKGPDTVHLLDEGGPVLAYRLPEFGLRCRSSPPTSPRSTTRSTPWLVGRALRLLAPTRQERVIDWFCGLGNFHAAYRHAG